MSRLLVSLSVMGLLLLSCNAGQSNSSANNDSAKAHADAMASATSMLEKNRATAMACLQGFNSHDMSAICKDLAPDYIDYGEGSVPPSKGLDSVKAGYAAFLAAFPDLKGENLVSLADGNHVAVFGDWSGTFKGTYYGMKPTNKMWKAKDVDFFTFNDKGQITEHRSVQALRGLLEQMGVKMKD